ncbi:MAG TPA: glycoside hydrolase family 172 protein, partial [Gemmatimonadota bacterium]|nr:glycoside hydrolase family 172 protein [Gemmatimonadota bacterium]
YLLTPEYERFLHVSSYDTTGGNVDRLEIAEGDSAVLLDIAGPGVIRHLWITVFSRDPHYLRRIALEMYWDGEAEPSVRAPLGDFFGNGFDKRHYAALPMGVSSGGFYVYLPMPFQRRARIVVRNGTGRTIDAFYYNIDLAQVSALPGAVATFHAWWHRDPRTTDPAPHLVLNAKGRGNFVGLSMNTESHAGNIGFLEGDEIYYVDGEFRGMGTGTEDYFNGGWYFDQGEFAAPYHGVVVKDEEMARIAAYRWHLADPIMFRDSIRVELEHGHANEEVADYATMAYWYQTEPHEPLPPLPSADERRVLSTKISPGATPRDSLSIEVTDDGLVARLPPPRPDIYEVLVYPLGTPGGGQVDVRLAGGPRRSVSLEAEEVGVTLAPVVIDTTHAAGPVEIHVSGNGPAPLAAVQLRPVQRWAREWSVVGPFANPQRLGSEYSPAIDSIYGPEEDPGLRSTYVGFEGAAVSWKPAIAGADGRVRLNGHFTPNDWVVAYAQAFLYSPDDREATLMLGADDAHVLWVNGERLSERQGRHVSVADEIAVPVRLRPGWNRVLLKVADLDGGWAFLLRAADATGQLRWAARP